MGDFLPKKDIIETENRDFCANDFASAKFKFDSHTLVKAISLKVREHKISYHALRSIFRQVQDRCGLKAPKREKRLLELPTALELDKFYGGMDNPIHQLIFEVLEGTGLRVSELCNLEISRIDFANNTIFVSQGKGKKDRICVMGNRLKEKLALYLQGKNLHFLFENARYDKYSTRRIEQLCEKYRKSGGIRKSLTPHTFRHIWNTKLAAANVTEEKRAILAGHSENSDVQKIYTHLSLGGFKDEVIAILDRT